MRGRKMCRPRSRQERPRESRAAELLHRFGPAGLAAKTPPMAHGANNPSFLMTGGIARVRVGACCAGFSGSVAQVRLPLRILQSTHSQERLCYSTMIVVSERSEELLFYVKSKRMSNSSARCAPRNNSFFFFPVTCSACLGLSS
jgi:hypothetical protein